MFKPIGHPTRALGATALVGALILAVPALAQTPSQTAATTTAPAAKAAPSKSTTRTSAPAKVETNAVEARINELHSKLKITASEEPQWQQFTQVMRENAKTMDDLEAQRNQNQSAMSAVDDLKAYRDFTQAHIDGLGKLIPAFESLYDTMTPDQKKNADMVFAQAHAQAQARKAAKGS
ncbi:MAG TPA: Spy/CpxP family protein refolding chaperone [Candidatus Sulfotelmatobacter sp.]|nr:Spy/CpxP family protein refolding chaperone [Candidatus Sulfotelmatobacter sp.]